MCMLFTNEINFLSFQNVNIIHVRHFKKTSDNTAKEEKSIHPEKTIANVLSIFL